MQTIVLGDFFYIASPYGPVSGGDFLENTDCIKALKAGRFYGEDKPGPDAPAVLVTGGTNEGTLFVRSVGKSAGGGGGRWAGINRVCVLVALYAHAGIGYIDGPSEFVDHLDAHQQRFIHVRTHACIAMHGWWQGSHAYHMSVSLYGWSAGWLACLRLALFLFFGFNGGMCLKSQYPPE